MKIKKYRLIDKKEIDGKEPEIFISRKLIIEMYNQLQEDDKIHTLVFYGELLK
jgi:hypothetical protein